MPEVYQVRLELQVKQVKQEPQVYSVQQDEQGLLGLEVERELQDPRAAMVPQVLLDAQDLREQLASLVQQV